MTDAFIPARGEPTSVDELRIPKARRLAEALELGQLPFVRLVECRRHEESTGLVEAVVLEVDVELGQINVHDIRPQERLAAVFTAEDASHPMVLALRADFPQVPHLYLLKDEKPLCLCLYDLPYSELKLRWSPISFVQRIRWWLAETAKETLHQEDQPLEPLLPGGEALLILPAEFLAQQGGEPLKPISLWATSDVGGGSQVLLARPSEASAAGRVRPQHTAIVLHGKPQLHGIMWRAPRNIWELHQFLEAGGIDLLAQLRQHLGSWQTETDDRKLLSSQLVVITVLPKTRHDGQGQESYDLWGFIADGNVEEVGKDIGLWEKHQGQLARLLTPAKVRRGERTGVGVAQVLRAFDRVLSTACAGLPERYSGKVVAVGLGALGSQVVLNLVRMGVGEWTLIDNDVLLPHNLARHALPGWFVGFPKATSMADLINETVGGIPMATPIVADVMVPRGATDEVRRALEEANVILDMSASISVARHLTRDAESPARRISVFFSPSGRDLVLLAEDGERRSCLDHLEMQYYRHVVTSPALQGHLAQVGSLRYGQSCRDISSRIPQDLVALQAAIASRVLRSALLNLDAQIGIWHLREDDLGVEVDRVIPSEPVELRMGGWTISTDRWLLDKVWATRRESLPNETGGVLVGAFDMQRRIIYVVHTLDSPPDSSESPGGYVRGSEGVRRRLEELSNATAGMLEYVGEWHSHPEGHSPVASDDDRRLLAWVSTGMRPDGKPGLVLIEGEDGDCSWYLGIPGAMGDKG